MEQKRFNQRCALTIFSPRANSLVVSSIMQTADVEHLIAHAQDIWRNLSGEVLLSRTEGFYVFPVWKIHKAKLECLLRRVNHCHRFLRLPDNSALFVAKILTPLDCITKLKLFLIALHRKGQISCHFYLSGDDELSGWTVFIALQSSALIPGRST